MFLWRNEVQPGVSVAFTDTDAGNLALHVGDDPYDVHLRRVRLEQAAGLDSKKFQFMDQVHGNYVEFIASYGTGPTADAMVSAAVLPNGWPQPLAVMVADCVPVVLVGTDSSDRPVIAVAHAGRPGVASGIVPSTVAEMRHRGAGDIRAWVGPSICGSCYEVPDQLRSEVSAEVPATWSSTSWGTPSLDLPAGVKAQLDESGVAVEYLGECTLESDSLFSYRKNSRTGRFAGLVWTHE